MSSIAVPRNQRRWFEDYLTFNELQALQQLWQWAMDWNEYYARMETGIKKFVQVRCKTSRNLGRLTVRGSLLESTHGSDTSPKAALQCRGSGDRTMKLTLTDLSAR
ncbi:unnamed protein product [Discosporangium mesarthrocarpum]